MVGFIQRTTLPLGYSGKLVNWQPKRAYSPPFSADHLLTWPNIQVGRDVKGLSWPTSRNLEHTNKYSAQILLHVQTSLYKTVLETIQT